jgi:predicted nucleic acid-binding protein
MVVDSSVWIEILVGGPLAVACEKKISAGDIRVPAMVLYEVYRKIKAKASEEKALEAIGALSSYEILNLTREVALLAADLSLELKLGMADSCMLAHARLLGVPLFTLDNDFASLSGVLILRPKS